MKKVIVKGPALSRSGYGEQTRFAIQALRSRPELFDVYILNTGWGNTGQMAAQTEEVKWIVENLTKTAHYLQATGNQPNFDLSVQVTIPNEFEAMAAKNVGYTAGIETTKIAPQWIEKCNAMDGVITISTHSQKVLQNTSYTATNGQTGEEVEGWCIHHPIQKVGYPVREATPEPLDIEFTTTKNFLAVSQWGTRKNLDNTVRWFIEEYGDDPDVGLVLKTNSVADCIMDREFTAARLAALLSEAPAWGVPDRKCKIYLLHGEISEGNLAWLYRHPTMKALINLAHGEGWGLPMYEAACNELPLIAIPWSGQMDFICRTNKKGKEVPHIIAVDYIVKPVQKSAVWDGVVQHDSMWAFAREKSYKRALREAIDKEKHHRARAKLLAKDIRSRFQPEDLYKEFVSFLVTEADEEVAEWLQKIEEISEL